MKLLDLRCPSCGGIIGQSNSGRIVICEYCGSRFALDDEEANLFAEDTVSAREEDPADLPSMVEFAESACTKFIDDFGTGDSFRNTPKILRGLGIVNSERVFLIHDDTIMKSGKNGFAITERGLYCRELAEERTFHDWESFAKLGQPKRDSSCIVCDDKSVCYFTDSSDIMPELKELYRSLHSHARKCFAL